MSQKVKFITHRNSVQGLSAAVNAWLDFVRQVLDTGWMDQLAPNLDQIIGVCTEMESWFQKHEKHVLVLHCWVKSFTVSSLCSVCYLFSPSQYALSLPGKQRPDWSLAGFLHSLQQLVWQVTLWILQSTLSLKGK